MRLGCGRPPPHKSSAGAFGIPEFMPPIRRRIFKAKRPRPRQLNSYFVSYLKLFASKLYATASMQAAPLPLAHDMQMYFTDIKGI